MGILWKNIEDAIRAWVKSASGLDDQHVIWAHQTGTRPSSTFIDIALGDLLPIGTTDELLTTYHSGAPVGQEIEIKARGQREFGVTIQCFGAPVTGNSSARAILSKVQTALSAPTPRAALHVAGLSPY